jgi:hypothetical protein
VAYAEFTFADGLTHRVPITPKQARR